MSIDPPPDPSDDPRFDCVSLYGALTDQPLIEVRWPVTLPAMITPAQARRMAMILLEVANASEMDAVVYRWMRGRLGISTEQCVQVMADFRQIRAGLITLDPES